MLQNTQGHDLSTTTHASNFNVPPASTLTQATLLWTVIKLEGQIESLYNRIHKACTNMIKAQNSSIDTQKRVSNHIKTYLNRDKIYRKAEQVLQGAGFSTEQVETSRKVVLRKLGGYNIELNEAKDLKRELEGSLSSKQVTALNKYATKVHKTLHMINNIGVRIYQDVGCTGLLHDAQEISRMREELLTVHEEAICLVRSLNEFTDLDMKQVIQQDARFEQIQSFAHQDLSTRNSNSIKLNPECPRATQQSAHVVQLLESTQEQGNNLTQLCL